MKTQLSFLFFFTTLITWSQQTSYVDFKTCNATIDFDTSQSKVFGEVAYGFKILKDVDSVFINAKNMIFSKVELDSKTLNYKPDSEKLWLKHPFKAKTNYVLTFRYDANPKKAMYFIDWNYKDGNKQIWTQGQGKYTSNWLPSIDDMNDKIEFDLNVVFDKDYEVIANGSLTNKQINDSTIIWHYNMGKPMSSYLVAIAIGKYHKKVEYAKSGIPLEMYYYPKDSLKVEPTYRYSKQMFDFLEEEIGFSYPWQNYKQIPVKDFLYSGMENTSATIFSDGFVVDSIGFVNKNYVNVNAHELAHQWFGDLVTETSGTHHWLHEGFATYYALLAERDVFGEDYYYQRLYEYAQELIQQDKTGKSTSLLDPKSSSVTFYKKGAWVLHMLKEQVGDKAFKKAVKKYLQKHKFKNVETHHFISEIEKTSGEDLDDFVNIWLESQTFNYDLALQSLKKSPFIQEFLMTDCEVYNSKCEEYLSSGISDYAKINIVSQIPNRLKKEDFANNVKVRQAIVENTKRIPLELKTEYESLLDDKSYETIGAVLFKLFDSFPEDRNKYLDKVKNSQAFNNKDVYMLWLTLALVNENYELDNKKRYFETLIDYTNPKYGFEIRQSAFQFLNLIQACNDVCKEHLEQATKHHNWRFSKFAKTLLEAN